MVQGLAFLSKKSWHTKNLANQEKVWMAEQREEAEASKTRELARQIQQEREQEELDRISGKKTIMDRGINWMYEGGKTGELAKEDAEKRAEEFLLGKEFGGETVKGDFDDGEQKEGINNVLAPSRPDSHSHQDLQKNEPIRPMEEESVKDRNESFRLRVEDPMFLVNQKQREKTAKADKNRELYERVVGHISPRSSKEVSSEDRKHEMKKKKKKKKRSRHHDDSDESDDSGRRRRSSRFRSRSTERRHRRRERSRSRSRSRSDSRERHEHRRKRHRTERRHKCDDVEQKPSCKQRDCDDDYRQRKRGAIYDEENYGRSKGREHDDRDSSDKQSRHRSDERKRSSSDRKPHGYEREWKGSREQRYRSESPPRRNYGREDKGRSRRYEKKSSDHHRREEGYHHAKPAVEEGYGLMGKKVGSINDDDLGPDKALVRKVREKRSEERKRIREVASSRRRKTQLDRTTALEEMQADAKRREEAVARHSSKRDKDDAGIEGGRKNASFLREMAKQTHGVSGNGDSLSSRVAQNRHTNQRLHESFF